MRDAVRLLSCGLALLCSATLASGQTVTVVHNVNLRPDPSTEYPTIRLLTPSEPPLTLLEAIPQSGYYHVRTSAGEDGYVWGREVRVSAAPGAPTPPVATGAAVPGSASMVGCGDSLWQHVYHPSRLLVQQDCITVTGVIIDATGGMVSGESYSVPLTTNFLIMVVLQSRRSRSGRPAPHGAAFAITTSRSSGLRWRHSVSRSSISAARNFARRPAPVISNAGSSFLADVLEYRAITARSSNR